MSIPTREATTDPFRVRGVDSEEGTGAMDTGAATDDQRLYHARRPRFRRSFEKADNVRAAVAFFSILTSSLILRIPTLIFQVSIYYATGLCQITFRSPQKVECGEGSRYVMRSPDAILARVACSGIANSRVGLG